MPRVPGFQENPVLGIQRQGRRGRLYFHQFQQPFQMESCRCLDSNEEENTQLIHRKYYSKHSEDTPLEALVTTPYNGIASEGSSHSHSKSVRSRTYTASFSRWSQFTLYMNSNPSQLALAQYSCGVVREVPSHVDIFTPLYGVYSGLMPLPGKFRQRFSKGLPIELKSASA